MLFLRPILTVFLLLASFTVFSQTDKQKTGTTRLIIEPYVMPAIFRIASETFVYRHETIPGINLGVEINKKVSILLGLDHFKLEGLYNGSIRCNNYPCPNTIDLEIIDVSLEVRYRALNKNRFSLEPFFGIYDQITIDELHYYQNNKENEQWKLDLTPYGFIWVGAGTYLNYSVFEKMNLFVAPTFKIYVHQAFGFAPMIGARLGSTFYF